jgi:carbon-monoxide dehydrogenase medium subunit
VKPVAFKYVAVTSPDELYEQLARYGEEARILAGGQSLVPMMNMRVATPSVLLDINRCQELGGISRHGDTIRIGALTRHRETESAAIIRDALPLVAAAMPHVAHLAIRNRGTFGGSLALADPAAELPACALLLDATMEVGSRWGIRHVPAAEFFLGLYTTALGSQDLLKAIIFPVGRADEAFAFREVSRRHGDFALAGVAVRASVKSGRHGSIRIAAFGVADRPVLLPVTATFIESLGGAVPSLPAMRDAVTADLAPYRAQRSPAALALHLTSELARRCLVDLGQPKTHMRRTGDG